MQTLLIDHYDSYTYNLAALLTEVNGSAPLIVQHDHITLELLEECQIDQIVIASGSRNKQTMADMEQLQQLIDQSRVPVLGISLGHEKLAQMFGAQVKRVTRPIIGQARRITHEGDRLFAHIPETFEVVRYHAFHVDEKSVPSDLMVLARAENNDIMALKHKTRPVYSVQYNPESIASTYGEQLLRNFKEITLAHHEKNERVEKQVRQDRRDDVDRQEEGTMNYTIRSERLTSYYDPEIVFSELFGEASEAFWLDSSRAEKQMARFSFMGSATGPFSEVIAYDLPTNTVTEQTNEGSVSYKCDIFDYIDKQLKKRYVRGEDLPFDFQAGYVGYFGYELKGLTGGEQVYEAQTPDAYLLFADRVIVFDHEEKATYLLELTHVDAPKSNWLTEMAEELERLPKRASPPVLTTSQEVSFQFSRNKEEYIADIEAIQEKIAAGETYEVTLTNELTTELDVDPLALYRILRQTNPAPYAAYLRFGELAVLSSSPERFLKVDRQRNMSAKPIKGTIQRSADQQEDEELLRTLRESEKNRAENLMIVDLLRSELYEVADPTTVQAEKLMDVESFETVHQLVSTIAGRLRKDATVVDAIRATHAGGSMTGAPKIQSMHILDELEKRPRGIYSGAIGFIGLNGTMDLSIVIRSLIKRENILSLGVGGAVTLLSDAEEEYDEMLLKAEALIQALNLYTGRAE